MNSEFPSYAFKLEWFDEQAELIRPYILTFRTERNEIEIFDIRQKRPLLKRTPLHNVRLTDLYAGNKILINGRQYDVLDFEDEFTRKAFANMSERTYAMIKPGFSQHLGDALERIYKEGLFVAQMRMGMVSRATAAEFYAEHEGKPFYETLMKYITSGPIVALELVGKNAIQKWRQIIGPTNLEVAKRDSPNCLRAQFARSTTENFAHGSDAPASAAREIGIIFGNRRVRLTYSLDRTSLLLIKPHAVRACLAGKIIKQVADAGFTICGAMMTATDVQEASEFYDVYRGVVEEYTDMVKQLSEGPCIAVEVAKDDGDVVNDLRTICGPRDVPIAKAIEPQSIRAKYGEDIVRNAVHCTDLPDDAQLEVEYFFTLLDQKV